MNAERAALADEAVEQERRIVRNAVVSSKELLEFVDHQQDPRHHCFRLSIAIPLEILHAMLAEQVAAALQLQVEPLQHAHAKLPFAFDGDYAGVRQAVL